MQKHLTSLKLEREVVFGVVFTFIEYEQQGYCMSLKK